MRDDEYLKLPNADYEIMSHPNGTDNTIEIGLVKDHRFAFYFWFKWWKKTTRKLKENVKKAPSLVTIDWHRDLFSPSESEQEDLMNLNLNSYKEVALFSWDKLNQLNDGHILSAAYLNLIGDIYVLCKQEGDDDSEESIIDHWGNEHKIICCKSIEELFRELSQYSIDKIYFDIDLDYFTESNDPCGGGENVRLMSDSEITSILDIDSEFMKWIFQKMEGMTIATEPDFCGGVSNSNKIYNLVDSSLFNNYLFSKNAIWKHLS